MSPGEASALLLLALYALAVAARARADMWPGLRRLHMPGLPPRWPDLLLWGLLLTAVAAAYGLGGVYGAGEALLAYLLSVFWLAAPLARRVAAVCWSQIFRRAEK
jgi:hypothetical protein